MADTKEIRNKIGSIKNTQKITKAMEMVAASKMRKAQQRMTSSKPYFLRIREVISHLSKARPEYQHMYLKEREQIKRVGFIVITSDRGLCGGLNVNLLKTTIKSMKQWHDKNIEIDLCLIGGKGVSYFKRTDISVVAKASHLGDVPGVHDLIGVVKVMLNDYEQEKLDAIYLCFNEFVNTMTQAPQIMPLLPIIPPEKKEFTKLWDYIYEPDAKDLIVTLLTRYIESQVYQGVIENIACEQAARMVAMKSATDNAGDLIKGLQLDLNKARQAAITQELSEIISGAAAV